MTKNSFAKLLWKMLGKILVPGFSAAQLGAKGTEVPSVKPNSIHT